MKLTIQRGQTQEAFTLQATKAVTLLSALYEIKAKLDSTLTFGAGCRSGVCGSCAVLVNSKEQLACSYRYQEDDLIEPLRYHPVLRDLKVDKDKAHSTLEKVLLANSLIHYPKPTTLRHPELDSGSTAPTTNQANKHHIPSRTQKRIQTPQDEAKTKIQTDCILCDSCYSSCPVLAVNPDFMGPFALTRAWRYVADKREVDGEEGQTHGSAPTVLENIQNNGIWDCTLCGECTIACPQGIDPKTDIMMLRGEAGKAGYMDPNFGGMDFGTPDFRGGF